MQCQYCNASCKKKGWYKQTQKYQCTACSKYQRLSYSYQKTSFNQLQQIIVFNNEGLGIRSIGRILQIAPTTVQRKILGLAKAVNPSLLLETNQEYEVDELCTFVGNKSPTTYTYISYAINRKTKQVMGFVTGSRSKENLRPLIDRLISLSPKRIYTDKLNVYPLLIPSSLHRNYQYATNRIERFNLTLRTRLKRLGRKTICFSKSIEMLKASLQLLIGFAFVGVPLFAIDGVPSLTKSIKRERPPPLRVFTNGIYKQDFVHVIMQVKTPCMGGVF